MQETAYSLQGRKVKEAGPRAEHAEYEVQHAGCKVEHAAYLLC